MLSTTLRYSILLALIIYFVILAVLLKKKRLALWYTLLWLFSGVVMLVLLIFPQLLNTLTKLLGIELQSNALFAMLFFCVLIILVSLTSIISKQNESIKELVQYTAMLEKRLRDIEVKYTYVKK